jgi:hypothetical protein
MNQHKASSTDSQHKPSEGASYYFCTRKSIDEESNNAVWINKVYAPWATTNICQYIFLLFLGSTISLTDIVAERIEKYGSNVEPLSPLY